MKVKIVCHSKSIDISFRDYSWMLQTIFTFTLKNFKASSNIEEKLLYFSRLLPSSIFFFYHHRISWSINKKQNGWKKGELFTTFATIMRSSISRISLLILIFTHVDYDVYVKLLKIVILGTWRWARKSRKEKRTMRAYT